LARNATGPGRTVTSKIVAVLMISVDGGVHSVTEIARLTGISMTTTHRLVTELARHGVLTRDEDHTYRVGPALQVLSGGASDPSSIAERARGSVEDLSWALRTHIRLGVLYDDEVAFIEKAPGDQPPTWFSASACVPAHATALGKAMLAFSERAVVERVIARGLTAYTPYTLTLPDRLRRELIATRLRGLAVDRGEFELKSTALAVPVLGPGGQAVAALSARARHLSTDLRTMQPALRITARMLSRYLMASGVLAGLLGPGHPDEDAVAARNGAPTGRPAGANGQLRRS
jgi:IclR family acetate operon transcriptional repressor